jgi:hypothetical protein
VQFVNIEVHVAMEDTMHDRINRVA